MGFQRIKWISKCHRALNAVTYLFQFFLECLNFPLWRPCEGWLATRETLNGMEGSVTHVKIPVGLAGTSGGGGQGWRGAAERCQEQWPTHGKNLGMTGKWRQTHSPSFHLFSLSLQCPALPRPPACAPLLLPAVWIWVTRAFDSVPLRLTKT